MSCIVQYFLINFVHHLDVKIRDVAVFAERTANLYIPLNSPAIMGNWDKI